jgi:hypothetical protein
MYENITPSVQADRFSFENLCVCYALQTLILVVVVWSGPILIFEPISWEGLIFRVGTRIFRTKADEFKVVEVVQLESCKLDLCQGLRTPDKNL